MRLFTALCFDEETKNALFAAEKTAQKTSSGNFSSKENLHLTLVFIGETDRREDLEKALSKIRFPSFEFEISGTGTFEKGILWAGIKENQNLKNLQKLVFEKIKSAGFEPEEREYLPHITLARKFRKTEDFDFSKIAELLPQKRIRAEKISLMKSERIDGVLCYTEIFCRELY